MKTVPGLAGLPARIKWVREAHLGLRSPRQMATALARYYGKAERRKTLSHVTIWRYEEGERTPTAVEIFSIAEFAKVSPAWLLTGEGPVDPGTATDYAAGARAALLEVSETVSELWNRYGGGEPGPKEAGSRGSASVDGRSATSAAEQASDRMPKPSRRSKRKKA